MSYHYFVVDAFTETAFGGVPVAVFPDTSDVPHALYATLASEMVSADTVFISKHRDCNRFEFQVFDQYGEAQPGAHALIAGIEALVKSEQIDLIDGKAQIKLDTVEDCIEAHIDLSSSKHPILLKQVLNPLHDRFVPSPAEIAALLGLNEADIVEGKYSTLITSCGKPYLIVPVKSYLAVREASFHQNIWARTTLPQNLVDKILLFAPNTDSSGADFHARLITQKASNHSDPAVSEAMPAFAAYLCMQESVQTGTHSFTVRRGANEARQSYIHIEMDNTDEPSVNVRIGGSAKATTSAHILLD
ncbi:MAG: trans-2,3-dihydro-3-hydroxyanthranilate isomerase [Flavobacteriales bacterium]|jgi:trans-2,3-dihydro-3-hydroxyanthranilate isomerase